jgi:5-methyltetrahydropteroyltriglutamate--homocysteine methyltransferase
MTQVDHTSPDKVQARIPARAEPIGSLLRSDALKEQFARTYGEGIYSNDLPEEQQAALGQLEEMALALAPELVQRQIDAGLDVVTDGELMRGLFTNSLMDAVDGIEMQGGTRAEGKSDDGYAIPVVTRPLSKRANPARREAEVLMGITSHPKKITFPAASYFYFQMFLEYSPDAYPDRDAMVDDIARIERQLVDEVIDAGIDYVQFDFPIYPMLVDPAVEERAKALGETPESLFEKSLAIDSKVVADLPAHVTSALHLCRGNTNQFFSGSIEPLAERLFALPYDRFLFEWHDVSDVGSYDSIRFVPAGKTMVMGLVSTKTPVIEDEDEVIERLESAARFLDMSQLGISPQCGFASAWRGHTYDPDVQWRKLEVVGRVADRVWGRP